MRRDEIKKQHAAADRTCETIRNRVKCQDFKVSYLEYVELELLVDAIPCLLDEVDRLETKRKHGEWAVNEFGHYCTACEEYTETPIDGCAITHNYCPNCGADMRKEATP